MTKKKTSEKLSTSLKNIRIDESSLEVHKPLEYLLDENNILEAIAECLHENDLQGIIEVVQTYKKSLRRAEKLKYQTEAHWPIAPDFVQQKHFPRSIHEAIRKNAKLASKK